MSNPMHRPTTPTARPAESYREVVAQLAAAQKKRAPGAPAYSIYVNRPLGRLFAAAAYRAGLTPNGVTAISAMVTFAGIVVLAALPASIPMAIFVALALVVGYALDSADGQVARLRGGGSLAGEWLDHVIDCIKNASLHLAVLIQFFRFGGLPNEALLLIPIGYSIVVTTSFFAMILNDQLKAEAVRRGAPAPTPRTGSSPLRALLVLPTDYGLLCVVFVLLIAPPVFFVAYALLFVANLGHLALALRKWFRDMSALG